MGLAGDLARTWAIIRRELMGPSHQTVLSQCWRKNNINLYVERYDHWHKFLNACIIMYISIQYVYHCISLYYSMKSQWTHKPQVPKSKHPQPFGHFRLNHRLAPGLAFEIWLRLRRCRLHPTGLEAFGTLEGWPHRWDWLVPSGNLT